MQLMVGTLLLLPVVDCFMCRGLFFCW